ncbi:MAG: siderophore biosynthesis protein PvsA [Limnobacter sp.]|uniref:ATP-grasp domain-containing protein n=1 Tax=Limnobacter sp. TaxID=2003368 RepID=UPI0032EE8249
MKPTLVFLTHVLNNAIVDGFIPAAQALNHDVIVLTDHGHAHQQALANVRVHECDVFNPIAVIDLIAALNIEPQAVFSNSDHLQTCTALVADLLGVPAKPWKICYHAKNKHWMRKRLESLGLPTIWSQTIRGTDPVRSEWPYPLVVKPTQGVASMDVVRIDTPAQLTHHLAQLDESQSVLLEEFMDGPLITLETLGDGKHIHTIGGFDVSLSSPPYFVETAAQWNGPHTRQWRTHMAHTLVQFGVGLGACHSEFIVTPRGPVLVEINYRSIGDNREFLLDQLVEQGWFKSVLQTHLGREIEVPRVKPKCAQIDYLVAPHAGTLLQAPHIENNAAVQYRAIKQEGDAIQISHSNKDYIGVFTFQADSESELQHLRTETQNRNPWSVQ